MAEGRQSHHPLCPCLFSSPNICRTRVGYFTRSDRCVWVPRQVAKGYTKKQHVWPRHLTSFLALVSLTWSMSITSINCQAPAFFMKDTKLLKEEFDIEATSDDLFSVLILLQQPLICFGLLIFLIEGGLAKYSRFSFKTSLVP